MSYMWGITTERPTRAEEDVGGFPGNLRLSFRCP